MPDLVGTLRPLKVEEQGLLGLHFGHFHWLKERLAVRRVITDFLLGLVGGQVLLLGRHFFNFIVELCVRAWGLQMRNQLLLRQRLICVFVSELHRVEVAII